MCVCVSTVRMDKPQRGKVRNKQKRIFIGRSRSACYYWLSGKLVLNPCRRQSADCDFRPFGKQQVKDFFFLFAGKWTVHRRSEEEKKIVARSGG